MRQRRPISQTNPKLAFLQLPRLGEMGGGGLFTYTHKQDLQSLPKFQVENALTSPAYIDSYNPFEMLNYTFQCKLSLLIFKISHFWGLTT